MVNERYGATRRALHGVAELLLAGPQHAASGHIKLGVVPGGIGTTVAPHVAIVGAEVVAGKTRIAMNGRTVRDLGAELALAPTSLAHVYSDVTALDPDEPLAVDEESAVRICEVYALGDSSLRSFAPSEEPVLWPEHFDIAITLDNVNYGITPGDAGIETPYMYVGPWHVPAADDFWNASFGATRDVPATSDEVVAFFTEGRHRLGA